jgi:hypothetical protein
MELLWVKKIAKYGDGIITVIAIKDKLGEYVTIKMYIYIRGVYRLHLINCILGRILWV